MRNWKFIDAAGKDTGRTLFCPTREMADANCAPGERAIEFDASGNDHPVAPAREVALRRIRDVELMAGQRAQREALIDLLPKDHPLRVRLVSIDAQISALRKQI